MDPITYPYTVEIEGVLYEVLAPEGEPGYRVRLPGGQVTAVPGDNASLITAEGLEAALAAAQLPNLPAVKTALRNVAKVRRAALLAAGFPYGGKVIQTRDIVDVSNVEAAALKATNDAGYATYWITEDNSLLPLDAAGIIAMQSAMVDAGNEIYAAYITITAQIEAAADMDALDALRTAAATFAP